MKDVAIVFWSGTGNTDGVTVNGCATGRMTANLPDASLYVNL